MSTFRSIPALMFPGWTVLWQDLIAIRTELDSRRSPIRDYALILLLAVPLWFVYIPIHELLHAWGCLVTGGTVSELIIGREYGAEFLQRFFPFVKPETSKYAGRLTGFVPSGDLSYFFTVFAPYLLSLFPGVLFVRLAITLRRLWLLAPGLLTGLIPLANLTGDYFEMGGIIGTRIIDAIIPGSQIARIPKFLDLRSDDLFRLFGEIAAAPDQYGFTSIGQAFVPIAVIALAAILSIWLAGATYALGRLIARPLTPSQGTVA